MNEYFNILWQPLLPVSIIVLLAAFLVLIISYLGFLNRRIPIFRLLFVIVLTGVLLNPVLKKVTGAPTDTIINLLVDYSDSQALAGRDEQTRNIQADVLEKLYALEGADIIVHEIPSSAGEGETRFLSHYRNALTSQNAKQVGGSIYITDGLIQDDIEAMQTNPEYGPVHVILSGNPDQEFDRRIKIVSAPDYVVVGERLPVRLRVDEFPEIKQQAHTVKVFLGQEQINSFDVIIGEETVVNIPINTPGQMNFRFQVDASSDELSAVNNTALLPIQGVRSRLKVLLVSGQPHQGLRIWRNLLKSDPAVDLVHFTILRSFESIDITPPDELALIPFPTDELFNQRIKDFDLIIFDRYTRRDILLPQYFQNIVSFLKEGGGVLMVHGPEETVRDLALSDTALGEIMPYLRIKDAARSNIFTPVVSEFGARHPITAPLTQISDQWGHWGRYQMFERQSNTSHTLLEDDGRPLLIIDEVEKGRIAQFTTEQIWLWARGYDGGGPYGTIMKRLAHWLMKEPTLDYKPLKIVAGSGALNISYDAEAVEGQDLILSKPDGAATVLEWQDNKSDILRADFETLIPGFYRVEYGDHTADIVLGDINSIEYQELVSNPEQVRDLSFRTGGGFVDFSDAGDVDVSIRNNPARFVSGNNLIFQRSTELANETFEVRALLPWWLVAMLGIIFLTLGWLRQE